MVEQTKKFDLGQFLSSKGTIFTLLLLVIVATVLFGTTFFSWSNLSNVMRQISWYGIAAIGVNMCILIGGRDVSAGNTAMLTGMIFAFANTIMGWGVLVSVLVSLCVGPIVGAMNGFVIAKLKVRPMIATLSIGWCLQACGLMIYDNNLITVKASPALDRFNMIARSNLFGFFPAPFAVFLVLVFIMHLVTARTAFGRAMYAVGGDQESASMMGISVVKVKMKVHIICSCLACVSGLFLIARTNVGDPASCGQWGFTLMSTVVIGGTRMRGGIGDLRGVIIGVLIYGLISNMLTLGSLSVHWINLITGLIMFFAILSQRKMA